MVSIADEDGDGFRNRGGALPGFFMGQPRADQVGGRVEFLGLRVSPQKQRDRSGARRVIPLRLSLAFEIGVVAPGEDRHGPAEILRSGPVVECQSPRAPAAHVDPHVRQRHLLPIDPLVRVLADEEVIGAHRHKAAQQAQTRRGEVLRLIDQDVVEGGLPRLLQPRRGDRGLFVEVRGPLHACLRPICLDDGPHRHALGPVQCDSASSAAHPGVPLRSGDPLRQDHHRVLSLEETLRSQLRRHVLTRLGKGFTPCSGRRIPQHRRRTHTEHSSNGRLDISTSLLHDRPRDRVDALDVDTRLVELRAHLQAVVESAQARGEVLGEVAGVRRQEDARVLVRSGQPPGPVNGHHRLPCASPTGQTRSPRVVVVNEALLLRVQEETPRSEVPCLDDLPQLVVVVDPVEGRRCGRVPQALQQSLFFGVRAEVDLGVQTEHRAHALDGVPRR